VESDRLVVELIPGAQRYQLVCMTDVVSLSLQDGSGGDTPLATDHEDVADRREGYWLDGVFMYPSFDEGCDAVFCAPIQSDPEVGRLAYAVTGNDVPPEDLQDYIDQHGRGDWGEEAAEEVSVVESSVIEGSIVVRLAYHSDSECKDSERTDAVIIEL
jgi:hypothetical protein